MFTVKATYRSEIRKFSFPNSSFPTYSQINDQLSRVLPISTSYYLARLLFVQSPSAPFARILIGMEVHSEEEYEQHVRPFRGREWPNGLLRFTVYDEDSPREIQENLSSPQDDDEDILMEDSFGSNRYRRHSRRHEHRHGHGHHHGHHRDHHRRGDLPSWPRPRPSFLAPPPPPLPPPPPPPPPPFLPPPPPPFFSPFFQPPPPPTPPSLRGSPLIVPPPPILSPHPHLAHPAPPLPSLPPIQPLSQNYAHQQSSSPTVDAAETPVQRLFRRRGLRSVASAPVLDPSLPAPPLPPPPPPRPVSLYGEIQVPDFPPAGIRINRPPSTVSDVADEFEAQARADRVNEKGMERGTCCDVERSKQDISNTIRNFKSDIDRILSQTLHMEPAEVWGFSSAERQLNPTISLSSSNSEQHPEAEAEATDQPQLQPSEPEPAAPPAEASLDVEPVVHTDILCNYCRDVIIGVRHKCLDCPDFDLCSLCLATQPQNIGSHSKSHALFAIEEPGGVWVHTFFTGDGTPDETPTANEGPSELPNSTSDTLEETTTPVTKLAVHHASCDLCDSAIKGYRFKCFDCPDFDTCESCYAIVPAQHPGHSFARLRDSGDLKYPPISPPVHGVTCNECGTTISGVRYKCMHPACNNFDLCANCEAFPIPIHPTTHTMLKIREPDAYIPIVKRHETQGGPTPVARARGPQKAHDDDIEVTKQERPYIYGEDLALGIIHGQYTPVELDALPTPIPSNARLSGASPKPAVELVDVSYPEFENTSYEGSHKRPVSFAFGDHVVIESPDLGHPGHHIPNVAPLLPVPSPPPALATEFLRAVPSLHQNSQYTEELIPGLNGPDTRSAPWWGQSAWVPPTPPAPLPVPLRTPSTSQRSRSPELLVHFQDQRDTAPSSADTLAADTTLRAESKSERSPASLPHVPPMDFNELFDLTSQFRHLLELRPPVTPPPMPILAEQMRTGSRAESTAVDEASAPTDLASTPADDAGTPLSLVALLSRPEKTPRHGVLDGISPGRLLSQLLDSTSTASLPSPTDNKSTKIDEDMPLRASFVADNNIPDGQIFPPGAEFVKSWRMRNDGPGPWPADTELVFVAGDKLMIDKSERFKVGSVAPGDEVHVWTGEMKAPDVPGKYISYWRLCDNKGRRFGHSIWIDICVTEPTKVPTSDEGDGSLAASSVVMPHAAPSNQTAPIPSHDESTTAPLLSDTSSVSLIDVLSDDENEDDDEDSEVYEDSRSHFGSTPGNGQVLSPDVDYVVLSDGSDEL